MAEYGDTTYMRDWKCQVRAVVGSGSWVTVYARTNFVPAVNDTTADNGTYDSGIWGSDDVTGRKWQLQLTLQRRSLVSTGYDAGQEIIRAAADAGTQIDVRWWKELTGATGEAYSGVAKCQWNPQGGDSGTADVVQAVLLGQGTRTAIAVPTPSVAAYIHLITEAGATPSLATAGGDRVAIYGRYFTGVTGSSSVTFGGTNATNYQVESDGLIIATSPAKTAGAHNVVVTNGTGASNNYSVTYA